jgi:polygalacturonase
MNAFVRIVLSGGLALTAFASAAIAAVHLENKQHSKYLQATNTTDQTGAAAKNVRGVNNTLTGDQTQWTLVDAGAGTYRVQSVASGLFLQCTTIADESGAGNAVRLVASVTGGYGQWRKVPTTGGYFRLENVGSGFWLQCMATDDLDTGPSDGGRQVRAVVTTNTGAATEWREVNIAPPTLGDFRVDDYGARASDNNDDTAGVQAALNAAKAAGGGRVLFSVGTYDFKRISGYAENQPEPSPYLVLDDANNITLEGAVDADGAPATLLLKNNDLQWGQPRLISMVRSSNLKVRNFKVDLNPYYNSAGTITRINKSTNQVDIEVLPGHPRVSGQEAHKMGLYDMNQKRILVNRITWDGGAKWTATGSAGSRTMTTNFANLASIANVGETVFWFQGSCDKPIMSFFFTDTLLIENVRIFGGHGFSLTCNNSRDVTYRDVRVAPPSGRIVTTVRDGLKLFNLTGRVVFERVRIDGCAGDDGTNMHGRWIATQSRVNDRTLLAKKPDGSDIPVAVPLIGDTLRILDANFAPWWTGIVTDAIREGDFARIEVNRDLPASLPSNRAIEFSSTLVDSALFKDCVFRNTGRYGMIVKAQDTIIDGCTFEYNYAGIRVGAEWGPKWFEATDAKRLTIKNCTFRSNDTSLLSATSLPPSPGLGIFFEGNAGKSTDIYINNNTFIDEGVPITLSKADRVWIWNNTYQNCGTPRVVNDGTATNVNFTAPPP